MDLTVPPILWDQFMIGAETIILRITLRSLSSHALLAMLHPVAHLEPNVLPFYPTRDKSLVNRNCLLTLPLILRIMRIGDVQAISVWIGVSALLQVEP